MQEIGQQILNRYLPKQKQHQQQSTQDEQDELLLSCCKKQAKQLFQVDWTPLSQDWLTQQKQNLINALNTPNFISLAAQNQPQKYQSKIKYMKRQATLRNATKVLFKYSIQQSQTDNKFPQDSLNNSIDTVLLQGYDCQRQTLQNQSQFSKSCLGVFQWYRNMQDNRFHLKYQGYTIESIQEYTFIKKLRMATVDSNLQLIGKLHGIFTLKKLQIQKMIGKSLMLCGIPYSSKEVNKFTNKLRQKFKSMGRLISSQQVFQVILFAKSQSIDKQNNILIPLNLAPFQGIFWKLIIAEIEANQQLQKFFKKIIQSEGLALFIHG